MVLMLMKSIAKLYFNYNIDIKNFVKTTGVQYRLMYINQSKALHIFDKS